MKTKSILASLIFLSASLTRAEETPKPPEAQKLAENLVAAIKSSDNAALLACWHTPEALAKAKQAEEAAEAAAKGKTETPEDLAKDGERELKRRAKENEDTTERAARLRAFLSKRFGELSGLTLQSLKLDADDDAPADAPAYDDVDLVFKTADGITLSIGVDDLIKLDGVWKFKGRLNDDIRLELPEIP
jgi:hypothetical protein